MEVLMEAACNADRLDRVLNLIPESQRVGALTTENNYGLTSLMRATHDANSLDRALNLIPEDQRAGALTTENNNGNTALIEAAAINANSLDRALKEIPDGQRAEALTTENNNGHTALMAAASNADSLDLANQHVGISIAHLKHSKKHDHIKVGRFSIDPVTFDPPNISDKIKQDIDNTIINSFQHADNILRFPDTIYNQMSLSDNTSVADPLRKFLKEKLPTANSMVQALVPEDNNQKTFAETVNDLDSKENYSSNDIKHAWQTGGSKHVKKYSDSKHRSSSDELQR